MENLEFDDIYELYERVLPALRSKVKELRKLNIYFIREKDIFEYLTNAKWNDSKDLTLDMVVDDILMLNNDEIFMYMQDKIINNKESED